MALSDAAASQVGGNAVAGFRQHDVADHEAFRGHGQSSPIAQDRGFASEHRANGLKRLFRPPLLNEPDDSIDEDDGEDDHSIENVTQKDSDER